MAHDYGLFIGGEERPARSGAVTGVRSPATGGVIGHVAEAGEGDVADAVTAAVSAARGWAATARSQRAERLCHLAELVARSAGELAAIGTSDAGRPVTAAKNVDLPLAGEVLTYFAGIAGKTEGRAAPVPGGFVGYSVREPFGVAAGILPWRCPLLQAVWKIAPALAAGNTVVVKPAEQAPLSPMALVRLAREAGIPPGAVNAVPGQDAWRPGTPPGTLLRTGPRASRPGPRSLATVARSSWTWRVSSAMRRSASSAARASAISRIRRISR